ncbi:MAG TPA: class I SAM-dependent methyltransferase [Polyangiaceae bacterium]|jgi:ubiquinone/menaquinone biosynthesis C-methylase UbiE|nr:class I SAM-dependent methyltransferase [Polyangiaceae bacterium]
MDASGSKQSNKSYYDVFSQRYEDIRGDNDPGGYHNLLDELESDFVARFGTGRDVLEVGCGTGLVLDRIAKFARNAKGVDLSPGMLEHARRRGLDVQEGSATQLPFADGAFDVACSFKVLAHIPDIQLALSEMSRVVRPGGVVLAEFYNPYSFRGLIKHFGPKLAVGENTNEGNVFIRFDSPAAVERLTPAGCKLIDARGVRIAIPFGQVMRVPVLKTIMRQAELALCDSPAKRFGGFYIAAFQKQA